MVRTQISLTEQQAEGLQRLAAARRRSQAALIREALDELLAREDRLVRIERARQAIGRYGSGRRHTAVEHDAALEEAFDS